MTRTSFTTNLTCPRCGESFPAAVDIFTDPGDHWTPPELSIEMSTVESREIVIGNCPLCNAQWTWAEAGQLDQQMLERCVERDQAALARRWEQRMDEWGDAR